MKAIYAALQMASAASIVEAFGLYSLRAGNILVTSLIYGLGVVPLLSRALKYEGIGIVNLLFNIMTTLFGFGIGIFIFNERIHYLQIIGALLSLLGIGLIVMAPKEEN